MNSNIVISRSSTIDKITTLTSYQMRQTCCIVSTLVIIYTCMVLSDKQDTVDQARPVERITRLRGERVSFQCEAFGEGE